MPRLLIVDDEDKIREVVKEYALFEGYEVEEAADGMQAIEKVKMDKSGFDCIVMDIMMPRLDGYSACKEIKKLSSVPVIMLSARGEEYDKLFGFEVGIDDYVVKPFSPKELMARIKVVVNRRKAPETEDVIRYKGLEINFAAREVTIDGKKVQMTPKEYDILFYLRKAFRRGLGIRLLRRRQNGRHPHKNAQKQLGSLQGSYSYLERNGIQV